MSNLPKVTTKPLFKMKIPSINREVTARPFVVREEKILLTAQQSGDDKDIILALKQILKLCIVDDFDAESLATFDLEYMFLKLRARSVNNVIDVSYQDIEDKEVYDFKIDLDEVELLQNYEFNNKFMLTEDIGIVMKYPSINIINDMLDDMTPIQAIEFLIVKCIDQIFDAENVYPAEDYTHAELDEFIDQLDSNSFEKVKGFFDGIPSLYHKLEYTNKLGNLKTIELTSLNDFFTWR